MTGIIAAARKHATSLPRIGDVVQAVGANSIEYDQGRSLTNVTFHNQPPQNGDVVTSVHMDVEFDEVQIRVSVAHGDSTGHASGASDFRRQLRRDERIVALLREN